MDKFWKLFLAFGTRGAAMLLLFLVASCGTSTNQDVVVDDTAGAAVDFGKIIDDMPAPTSLPVLLQRSDIPFSENLTNPSSRAQDYLTTDAKAALNLGVFSTDLGYLSAYSQVDKALTYFKSSQTLVEHLKIAGAFEMAMMQRFEANLNNQDSLLQLVNQSTSLTKTFLNENERYSISAMIVTGSFVEGLYIATQSVMSYPEESFKDQLMVDMVRTIANQETPLADLITLLGNTDDPRAKELLTPLKGLKAEFEALDLKGKLADNTGGFVLKAESISGITSKVAGIRASLVE